jgi:UDP-N-acetylmuramoylalanine-D-glutamate ligase
MKIQDLLGKKICMLGYGREGKAMVEAIRTHVKKFKLTVADENPDVLKELAETTPYYLQSGANWLDNLETFDVIIKSPGIPPNPQLDAQHSKLTSSTQIFFDTIAESGSTVIGVTGSKGKSTTASLLFAMLKLGKKEVHLVGNIGEPAISHIHDAKNRTLFVMEMSSYQLMDLTVSPQIAVITSFFPEHLNYHGSLEAYMEAKKHITKFQKPGRRCAN